MSEEKVNKATAIREALATMGVDASPSAVVERLKSQGVEVSPNYVSLEKSKLKKAGESGVMRSPEARPSVTTPTAAKLTTTNVVDLILTIKQLILDVGGKEELKRLIDAL